MNRLRRMYHMTLAKLSKLQLLGLCLILLGLILLAIAAITTGVTDHRITTHSHAPQFKVAVVQINSSGFMPATLVIQENTEVTWVNNDNLPHLVAANPYPTHTSFPSLVAPRALGENETYSFLFTKAETVYYHDDLNPKLNGAVIVKK